MTAIDSDASSTRLPRLRRAVTFVNVVAVLGAVFFIAFGLWPFLDASSFFDEVAHFEPYNAHFLHDVGAFQVGIGVTLLLALWRRTNALFAALGGAGVASAFHAIAHIRDDGLGGSDSDPFVFGGLAVLLVGTASFVLLRDGSRGRTVPHQRLPDLD